MIGCLEWVDDVLTMTQDIERARAILIKVNDFAKANKLKWGLDKCIMMAIGKKTNILEEWQLGNQVIGNTSLYKYLGDEITSDGKNNKAGYTATEVVCGWAGAIFDVTRSFGQEQ